MNQKEFRAELVKAMPGYKWTVHRGGNLATGIQSAGFNRVSTLEVFRFEFDGKIEYEVKSSGYGTMAGWIATRRGGTLRRALRSLQDHYETNIQIYSAAASYMKHARKVE